MYCIYNLSLSKQFRDIRQSVLSQFGCVLDRVTPIWNWCRMLHSPELGTMSGYPLWTIYCNTCTLTIQLNLIFYNPANIYIPPDIGWPMKLGRIFGISQCQLAHEWWGQPGVGWPINYAIDGWPLCEENIMFTMGMALNVNRIVFKTA